MKNTTLHLFGIFALFLSSCATAGDSYFGIDYVHSKQKIIWGSSVQSFGNRYDVSDVNDFPVLYLGRNIDSSFISSAEFQIGYLGKRTALNADYRGCDGCEVTQIIRSKYAAGILSHKEVAFGFDLGLGVGIAYVLGHNHEYGYTDYCNLKNVNYPAHTSPCTPTYADFSSDTKEFSPLVQFEVSHELYKGVALRLSYRELRGIIRSSHTLHSDVYAYAIGLTIRPSQ